MSDREERLAAIEQYPDAPYNKEPETRIKEANLAWLIEELRVAWAREQLQDDTFKKIREQGEIINIKVVNGIGSGRITGDE